VFRHQKETPVSNPACPVIMGNRVHQQVGMKMLKRNLFMNKRNVIYWFVILLAVAITVQLWGSATTAPATAQYSLAPSTATSFASAQAVAESTITVAGTQNQTYLPVIQAAPEGNLFYLSPAGNDSNSGTSRTAAWATFDRAWQDLYPGDTLILLDGVYYQSLGPNRRNGEPGKPITVRADNDGQAIIDGEFVRTPVAFRRYLPSDYYVIEGIVARNGSIPPLPQAVIRIESEHNILRRVSAYNAHTDYNTAVISLAPSAAHNLIEDCVAAGTGRKMINLYKSENNVIRRCFTYWQEWDGRESCQAWPNGQSIQVYHGNYNTIENSIAIGPVPHWSISIQANSPNADAIGNKILGSIAINAGFNLDGTLKEWGDTRPQPTSCSNMDDLSWPNRRSGFSLHGQGELRDNLYQDIFSWGNAGLGLVESIRGTNSNNRIVRATVIGNGSDNWCGPWPCQYGGPNTDALEAALNKFSLVQNSRIEKIYVDWPGYPNGERNMASMNGEGARLTHRYVDGVLTNEPLWPWPMEDRIQAELGISVTGLITGIIFAHQTTD
jgi:hypothetical protein